MTEPKKFQLADLLRECTERASMNRKSAAAHGAQEQLLQQARGEVRAEAYELIADVITKMAGAGAVLILSPNDCCGVSMSDRAPPRALHALLWNMSAKLDANRHKGGWDGDSLTALHDRLVAEICEAKKEIDSIIFSAPENTTPRENLIAELADVANFALMMIDKVQSEL